MQQTILFLNMAEDDPTKRLKLAGVRRYAMADGTLTAFPRGRWGEELGVN